MRTSAPRVSPGDSRNIPTLRSVGISHGSQVSICIPIPPSLPFPELCPESDHAVPALFPLPQKLRYQDRVGCMNGKYMYVFAIRYSLPAKT
ncbi:hypothetical protein EYC84_011336 [Monilinia fructicola]|uniref:Uncharacterized protein n=1 Tax=Monilinia fructicola TaxID=38448 RepID=A0A5M9J973_MONFR|nr:hypothetical protein EYC84_011336 [Monilinia fructicola]